MLLKKSVKNKLNISENKTFTFSKCQQLKQINKNIPTEYNNLTNSECFSKPLTNLTITSCLDQPIISKNNLTNIIQKLN